MYSIFRKLYNFLLDVDMYNHPYIYGFLFFAYILIPQTAFIIYVIIPLVLRSLDYIIFKIIFLETSFTLGQLFLTLYIYLTREKRQDKKTFTKLCANTDKLKANLKKP